MRHGFRVVGSERVSGWEWAQAVLLAANLAWTTLCLGGYRPETMLVTLLITGATVLMHCLSRARGAVPGARGDGADWLLCLFLGYGAANVLLVTPVPWLGWLDWFGWVNAVVTLWVVRHGLRSAAPRKLLFFVLIGLGIIAVGLASYQRFAQADWLMLGRVQVFQFIGRSSGPFGIPNSLAGYLILLLPVAGVLAFGLRPTPTERVWWGWVMLVFAFGLWLTVSRGGWIALGVALVFWPLMQRTQRWGGRAVSALVVLALVVAAGAFLYGTTPFVRDRFDRLVRDAGEFSRPILWRGAGKIFAEHPIVGGGAGSYNVRFEQHRPERFVDEPQWVHNEYLNTLSDYGLIGLGLLLGAVILMIAARRRQSIQVFPNGNIDWLESPGVRRGCAVGAMAFAFQMFVDFHLKIPALAMSLAVVGALALGWRTDLVVRWAGNRTLWWVTAGLVLLAMIPVARLYRAEALRYRAREAMNHVASDSVTKLAAVLPGAENDLRRAVTLWPSHAGAWADLAFALQLRAFADPAQVTGVAGAARDAASRAVALAEAVPEFWIRLGVAHDLLSQRSEAARAFEKAVKLAPRSGHAWYYYAHHLSLATDQRDAALRAIATSLSLDPANRAAEALQLKLNERSPGVPFNP